MVYNKFAPGSPARCAFRQSCVKFIITPVLAVFINPCHIYFWQIYLTVFTKICGFRLIKGAKLLLRVYLAHCAQS